MSKAIKEIIITTVLVVVLAVVVFNNLKKGKKSAQPKKLEDKPQAAGVLSTSPVSVSADMKAINLQKERLRTLAWGRDPFQYIEIETKQAYRAEALVLKGISLRKDKVGYAFINDVIVKEGDSIGGYEVVQIQKDKVLLRRGSEVFYLTLTEE